MRVATYNIHGCVGAGGHYAPDRIANVLKEIAPDILALQEVDTRRALHQGLHQFDYLVRETGLEGVAGPSIREHHGEYGNALLTRFPIVSKRLIDLSVSRREPRGAIDVRLALPDGRLRVIVTHLGLRARERREQIALLLALLAGGPHPGERVLMMGDFNEWWLAGHRNLSAIAARFPGHYGDRGFPAACPVLTLDRIFVHPRPVRAKARMHMSPLARRASDHLPVVADLTWTAESASDRQMADQASPNS